MATTQEAPINILMAEDDDDDYQIFTIALEETTISFRLSRAIDGGVLMKLLQESIPDILFLDLHMPCKDGHQCLKEIRADVRYDTLPIIIYSSMSDEFSVEKCYRDGSNLFMIKPTTLSELKLILNRVLAVQWKTSLYYPPKSGFVLKPGEN